ncbi:MAG: DUF3311 domain-containing protein [Haloarculaceae archaeon]
MDASNGDVRESRTGELVGWSLAALVLVALAVPWFMWGTSTVVAGLPVWVWWHVGWMALTAAVLWLFTRYAWGLGIEEVGARE